MESPAQKASNAESVLMFGRHYEICRRWFSKYVSKYNQIIGMSHLFLSSNPCTCVLWYLHHLFYIFYLSFWAGLLVDLILTFIANTLLHHLMSQLKCNRASPAQFEEVTLIQFAWDPALDVRNISFPWDTHFKTRAKWSHWWTASVKHLTWLSTDVNRCIIC